MNLDGNSSYTGDRCKAVTSPPMELLKEPPAAFEGGVQEDSDASFTRRLAVQLYG